MLSFFKKWNSRPKQGGNFLLQIEGITGFKPRKESLYRLAFTHSSVAKENRKGLKENNERLEFLGDAILGAVITEYLYHLYPQHEEGELTNMRSKLVSRKHLNELGESLGLKELLEYSPSRGTQAKSLNGDAFEALIGALFIDYGYPACESFLVNKVLKPLDLEKLSERLTSFKSKLLEWGQKEKKTVQFKLIGSEGKSHDPIYHVACIVSNRSLAEGSGPTKKKAEEVAAKAAYEDLHLLYGETQTQS